MITKKTALKEAGRFARALDGPLGRRPMQRAISEFLLFFRRLRSSGASWDQIATLLAAAGVRSSSGQPVSDGVLRAMVSRAERDLSAAGGAGDGLATKRLLRPSAVDAKATETPHSIPATTFQRPRADAHAALTDVPERIRRASALRAGGGETDRG